MRSCLLAWVDRTWVCIAPTPGVKLCELFCMLWALCLSSASTRTGGSPFRPRRRKEALFSLNSEKCDEMGRRCSSSPPAYGDVGVDSLREERPPPTGTSKGKDREDVEEDVEAP